MTRPATLLLSAWIVFLVVSAGCGGGGSALSNSSAGIGTRTLLSLTVTPSAADAQKFPNNQVQFISTATFTTSPTTVMSPVVRWSIGSPFATPIALSNQPSIDVNGLAQCNGFIGIVTILATAPVDPAVSVSQMTAITPNVSGRASLICP